jgi:hypothetical protein
VGRSGITNAAANAAISSGIVGTGIGLLSGQKLQDAVKSGVTAGAISGLTTGATQGFDAQIEMPTAPTVGEMLDKDAQATQPDPKDQVFSKPNYDNFRPVDAGDARGLPVVNPGEQMQIVPTSDLSSTGPDNSAYTGGRTSMGPAYDTGFGIQIRDVWVQTILLIRVKPVRDLPMTLGLVRDDLMPVRWWT